MTLFDLAIIGSGSAAFSAAIAARSRDKSVVMIENDKVGGTCVNVGCIPSKALLASAHMAHLAQNNPFVGIDTCCKEINFKKIIADKDKLVKSLQKEKYLDLAKDYGWEIIWGKASFTPGPLLQVQLKDGKSTTIEASHYLIATGSQPWIPPGIEGIQDSKYLTSTTAMELEELPKSLIVVGGNYIGLEQAQMFSRLGSKVTLIEMEDHLSPNEEPEVGKLISQVFHNEGIEVLINTTVESLHRQNSTTITATLDTASGQKQITATHILMATGRTPNTKDLKLDAIGVKLGSKGQVIVDNHLRTSVSNIWAAGDVTGYPQFVYVAGAHGAVVVDNALSGKKRTLDYKHLPRVTFTTPNIAAVGITESQAKQQGIDYVSKILPLEYVPRALVNRDTNGLIKILAEANSNRILGITVVAENAGDTILAGSYAIRAGMTVDDIADSWAPYLTMSEGIKLGAQTFSKQVSKLSCCAS